MTSTFQLHATEPGVGDSGSNNYSIRNLSYQSCQELTILSPNDLRQAPPIMNFLPHSQKATLRGMHGCKNLRFLEACCQARTGKPPGSSERSHFRVTKIQFCFLHSIRRSIFMYLLRSVCLNLFSAKERWRWSRAGEEAAHPDRTWTQPRSGKSSGSRLRVLRNLRLLPSRVVW